jgi:hypothetical protein
MKKATTPEIIIMIKLAFFLVMVMKPILADPSAVALITTNHATARTAEVTIVVGFSIVAKSMIAKTSAARFGKQLLKH